MSLPKGTRYQIHTYPSGKRVKRAVSRDGRVLEVIPMKSKADRTKTGKRLAKRRRRIMR